MIRFKMKRKFSVALILLLLISASVVFVNLFHKVEVDAQVSIETSTQINNEYAFGDVFVLPECTFSLEGQQVKGSASVEFPDGSLTNKTSISLTQNGDYTVKYIANLNGKVYTKEYKFTVLGKLANYTNNKTSMEYGLCTTHGANSEGLIVQIANGDSLAFDHVFDMKNLSMTTKLLEGFVIPEVQGSIDFAKMVFTFTDIEDPSVQLVYHGNFYDDPNAHGLTWFTAAGNGQVHCGLEHVGKLHVGATQGCIVPHSFMSVDTGLFWGHLPSTKVAPDSKKFFISYDAERNQAWAGGKIVSDLDDSYYYDKLWFGFPSGKAKLTISAMNYSGQFATMCFTSILGVDLSADRYVDDVAPEITINSDYEVMPNALVGKSYPVPTASAIDGVDGVCNVEISVWRNYGLQDATMVNVKDGKFDVNSVGVYTIEYSATDYKGNVARELLWIKAYSSLSEKLNLTLEEFEQTVELGTVQTLPKATATGGSGEITLSYTITQGNEICEIVNGTYMLEKAGEWTLICTATDYIGNAKAVAKTIVAVASGEPILPEAPVLPEAFISGSSYVLPTVYAYDYTSGERVEKLCDIVVSGSSTVYKAGETYVPNAENDNEVVTVSFVVDGATIYEKEVPVRIVFERERIPGAVERYRTVVDVEKYFHKQGDITLTKNYALGDVNGILLRADSSAEKAGFSFINSQIADIFAINFYTVPNAGKFSKMAITLTDSENVNLSVEILLIKQDGQTLLKIGDTEITLDVDFDGSLRTLYNVGFSKGSVVVNYTTKIAVEKYANGDAFEGFTSGKVNFSVELYDVEEGASIFMSEICGIKVSSNQDNVGPTILVDGEIQINGFKGDSYTISGVIVGDVLSPTSVAKLTVVSPGGVTATDVNGVKLENVDASKDYVITLNEYGTYYITVEATEEESWKFNNKSYLEYAIRVVDGEKPTITFEKEFTSQIKVGENLIIPKFTVADNFSSVEDIEVIIMITNPKGMPIYLYNGENAITCKYAGVYKVSIFVIDKTGNLTMFETTVTVS